MSHHVAERRRRIAEVVAKQGLDAMLVVHPVNVSYLSRFTGESSYLVLSRDDSLMISDGRYTEQLAEECPGLAVHIRPPSQPLLSAVAEVLMKMGLRNIGFESNSVTVAEWERLRELSPSIEWKAMDGRVEAHRAVKDEAEIQEIRAAIAQAEKAFGIFRLMLRPEDSEKELSDAMEMYLRRCGARGSSFPTIVAVGSRAALAHAPPTQRRVRESNLMLVDWGAHAAHYRSDLTRMLVTGKLDDQYRKIYNIVLQAQEKAIRATRPGVTAHDIDRAARSVIEDAGYGPQFSHGLGHGLGLQGHETPFLKQNIQAILQPGMVITIEPGIYLPNWGGVRIEDDVLVTPNGCEVLTSVTKDLEESICDFAV